MFSTVKPAPCPSLNYKYVIIIKIIILVFLSQGDATASPVNLSQTPSVSTTVIYCNVERNNDMMRVTNGHSDNAPNNPLSPGTKAAMS